MDNTFASVFDCYPQANEIYVVGGMPFLNPSHAQSHSVSTGSPVVTVKRGEKPAQVQETETVPGEEGENEGKKLGSSKK